MNSLGGGGINGPKHSRQFFATEKIETCPDDRVRAWAVEQSLEQRLVIERCSAGGNERHLPRRGIGNDGIRRLHEFGHREGLIRLNHVNQMMSNLRLFNLGRLGGSDVHPLVHLH